MVSHNAKAKAGASEIAKTREALTAAKKTIMELEQASTRYHHQFLQSQNDYEQEKLLLLQQIQVPGM